MAGTYEGGVKAAKANRERHGDDFYARIGSKGGKKSRGGGFAANRELASRAGKIGGQRSKRGYPKPEYEDVPFKQRLFKKKKQNGSVLD